MPSDHDVLNTLIKATKEHPDELDNLCTEFETIKMKKKMKCN